MSLNYCRWWVELCCNLRFTISTLFLCFCAHLCRSTVIFWHKMCVLKRLFGYIVFRRLHSHLHSILFFVSRCLKGLMPFRFFIEKTFHPTNLWNCFNFGVTNSSFFSSSFFIMFMIILICFEFFTLEKLLRWKHCRV